MENRVDEAAAPRVICGADGVTVAYEGPPAVVFCFRDVVGVRCRVDVRLGALPARVAGLRLVLDAASARQELRRALADAYGPEAAPWPLLCQEAPALALSAWRSGLRLEKMVASPESPADDYLLDRFLPRRLPTLLFGDGGCGKSLIAQDIALCLAAGYGWVAPAFNITGRPLNVLYADFEANRHIIQRRHNRLTRHPAKAAAEGRVFYTDALGALFADRLEAFHHAITANAIDLLIIDSAGFAGGGRPEEAETAIRFFNALNQLPVTPLVIAHQAKPPSPFAPPSSYPFGSIFWHNGARNIWHASRLQEPDQNSFTVLLRQTKSNADRLSSPFAVRISFNPQNETISLRSDALQDIAENPAAAPLLPLSKRAALALAKNGPTPLPTLASLTAADANALRATLRANTRLFTLTASNPETWSLRGAETPAAE